MRTATLKNRVAKLEAQMRPPEEPYVPPTMPDGSMEAVFRILYEVGPWCLKDVLRDGLGLSEDGIAWQLQETAREYEAWLAAGGEEASAD
jgi:hypothetical protein